MTPLEPLRCECGTAERSQYANVVISMVVSFLALVATVAFAGCRSSPDARKEASETRRPASAEAPLPLLRPVSVEERDQYAGAAACLECHPQYAEQLDSHHARTLSRVSLEKHGDRFRQKSGCFDYYNLAEYRTGVEADRCVLHALVGAQDTKLAAEYAFGSGGRGMTFLGYMQERPVELRLSHFARQREWEFTPGQPVGSRPGETARSGRSAALGRSEDGAALPGSQPDLG